MPLPVSDTEIVTNASSGCTSIETRPPSGVYLAALTSRFCRIWPSRVGSALTYKGCGCLRTSSECRCCSSSGRTVSTLRATTSSTRTRSRRSLILPVAMRPTSSRSSTSRVTCVSCRSMMSRHSRSAGLAIGSSCMTETALRIGASGLRSSCASIARNSFMRRLERSSSSRRRRCVMSRVTFAKPSSSPPRPWIAREDHVRPEQGAVLAHPPAFVLDAAVHPGRANLGCRLAGQLVLRRVEDAEVAADDLVGGVALQCLRAGVPAAHRAVHVEHEDGVVAHAVHQQPEALLAGAQFLLVALALGEVARDLDEAVELAAGPAHGRDDHVGPEARAVLAQAPAFVLEAALGRGPAQFLLRPSGRDGLGRIEDREMLADDLLARIALELLRAGVPGDHAALRVQHEDAVIDDALDQELEAVFETFLEAGGVQRGVRIGVQGRERLLGRAVGEVSPTIMGARPPAGAPARPPGDPVLQSCRSRGRRFNAAGPPLRAPRARPAATGRSHWCRAARCRT